MLMQKGQDFAAFNFPKQRCTTKCTGLQQLGMKSMPRLTISCCAQTTKYTSLSATNNPYNPKLLQIGNGFHLTGPCLVNESLHLAFKL